MFNKMFEAIARKQLTENAFTRFSRGLNNRHLEKLGIITTCANGVKGLDVVKLQAHNLKRSALMLGVVFPAAAVIGNVLGGLHSDY